MSNNEQKNKIDLAILFFLYLGLIIIILSLFFKWWTFTKWRTGEIIITYGYELPEVFIVIIMSILILTLFHLRKRSKKINYLFNLSFFVAIFNLLFLYSVELGYRTLVTEMTVVLENGLKIAIIGIVFQLIGIILSLLNLKFVKASPNPPASSR